MSSRENPDFHVGLTVCALTCINPLQKQTGTKAHIPHVYIHIQKCKAQVCFKKLSYLTHQVPSAERPGLLEGCLEELILTKFRPTPFNANPCTSTRALLLPETKEARALRVRCGRNGSTVIENLVQAPLRIDSYWGQPTFRLFINPQAMLLPMAALFSYLWCRTHLVSVLLLSLAP